MKILSQNLGYGVLRRVLLSSAQDAANYLMGMSLWDRRMKGARFHDYKHFPPGTLSSTEQYFREFEFKFGRTPGIFAAVATMGGYVIEDVVSRAQNFSNISAVTREMYADLLEQTLFTSFGGRVQYNAWHQNIGASEMTTQIVNGELQIIHPLEMATALIVYPMPTWGERRMQENLNLWEFQFAVGTCAASGLVVFILGGISIIFRKSGAIKIATLPFCLIILTGCGFIISGFATFLFAATDAACTLWLWLLGIGLSFTYGSLVAKCGYAYQVFVLEKSHKPYKFATKWLVYLLGAMTGVEILVLTLWTLLSSPELRYYERSSSKRILNYYYCTTKKEEVHYVFLCIQGSLFIILLLASAIMSYRVRKIQYFHYHKESKWIGMATYVSLGIFLVFGTLIFAGTMDTQYESLPFELSSNNLGSLWRCLSHR